MNYGGGYDLTECRIEPLEPTARASYLFQKLHWSRFALPGGPEQKSQRLHMSILASGNLANGITQASTIIAPTFLTYPTLSKFKRERRRK